MRKGRQTKRENTRVRIEYLALYVVFHDFQRGQWKGSWEGKAFGREKNKKQQRLTLVHTGKTESLSSTTTTS
jgi:hypothetical protein